MLNGIKIIKKYYKLAGVRPVFLFFQFLLLFIPSVFSILSPIIAAKIITAITVFDYSNAVNGLIFEFVLIFVSTISYFAFSMLSSKVDRLIALNVENHIYQNAMKNKNHVQISFATMNNVWKFVDFNKNLLLKTCFFLKSVALLAIIIYFNLIIGLSLIGVSFISYFLLKLTDSKIQRNEKELSVHQVESLNFFNSIHKGTSEEPNNISASLKNRYFSRVENIIKMSNKTKLLESVNNNFITLILKIAVFASTIYLISLVKSTTLTLSLYLILTPYLTSSAQNLIEFFNLFGNICEIDNILNEFQSLVFLEKPPENTTVFKGFDLLFFNISAHSEKCSILNLNINIKERSLVYFVGSANSGKKSIFNLLTKTTQPQSGAVLLNGKNISEIELNLYNSIVVSTSKNPYFYNVSIYENLYMVCSSKNKISNAVKSLNLTKIIDSFPEKLNSLPNQISDSKCLFFLGLLRSYLSGAKINLIYEIPNDFSDTEKELFEHILKTLNKTSTVIIFSNEKPFISLDHQAYFIKNSKLI